MRNSLNTDRTKKRRQAAEKHTYMVTAAIKKPLVVPRRVPTNNEGEENKGNPE